MREINYPTSTCISCIFAATSIDKQNRRNAPPKKENLQCHSKEIHAPALLWPCKSSYRPNEEDSFIVASGPFVASEGYFLAKVNCSRLQTIECIDLHFITDPPRSTTVGLTALFIRADC